VIEAYRSENGLRDLFGHKRGAVTVTSRRDGYLRVQFWVSDLHCKRCCCGGKVTR
jgi:hypothetical protein